MAFANKANIPKHSYNKCYLPIIKIHNVYITTGTLVLIRLYKKAKLLETILNCRKDGKILVDKNSISPGKE